MISKIGYMGFYFLSWIVWAIPLRVAYGISDLFYFTIYKIGRYRVKVVRQNLRNAFPEKTEKERLAIERKFYKHLCDLFIESMQLLHMTEQDIKRRFKYVNIELFEQFYRQGRHVIVVMGHYGNWELNIGFPLWCNFNTLATYKPLNNPYFNKRMQQARAKFGVEAVSMKQTAKKMFESAKSGHPTLLALIADQAPMDSESDFWTTFLHQNTSIFLGPEKIAQKLNAPVIFLDITKPRRGFYEVNAKLLFDQSKETKQYEITKSHVLNLELAIKRTPEYWLWSHRRWKRSMPANATLQNIYE